MTNKEVVIDKINDLHCTLMALYPNSRERATALTKLDECRLWVSEIPATEVEKLPENIAIEQS